MQEEEQLQQPTILRYYLYFDVSGKSHCPYSHAFESFYDSFNLHFLSDGLVDLHKPQ